MSDRITVFACARCDRHTGCPCGTGRTEEQIAEQHRQAVKRAERVATPAPRLTPVPADGVSRRPCEPRQRPPQRARPINGPSLDDTVLAVIQAVAS